MPWQSGQLLRSTKSSKIPWARALVQGIPFLLGGAILALLVRSIIRQQNQVHIPRMNKVITLVKKHIFACKIRNRFLPTKNLILFFLNFGLITGSGTQKCFCSSCHSCCNYPAAQCSHHRTGGSEYSNIVVLGLSCRTTLTE